MHNYLGASLENAVVKLQFLHTGHMSIRIEPISLQNRRQAIGRATDDMCPVHSGTRVVDGADIDAKLLLEFSREALAIGRRRAVDADLAQRTDERHCHRLRAGLPPGSDESVN